MAEKMLTNWFTFLLYKFLKVGLRGPVSGGTAGVGRTPRRHRGQVLGVMSEPSNPDYLLLAVSCVETCYCYYRGRIDIHAQVSAQAGVWI